ncbi:DUF4031 domain-containing protein [Streptomyces sp. NPDC008343]|uniref:DUF4031 domain-containing protein n=1 Tax=Streptomyces sp. NPDC008343 TaxID=3364828 RepID=UPI0036E53ED0
MTVFVDGITDYGDVARSRGLRSTRWAHLTANTPEELHRFAAGIGLNRRWFQNADNVRWHYDVTPGRRAAALKAGAREIDRRGLADLMTARRAAGLIGSGWTDGQTLTLNSTVAAVEARTTGQGAPWAVAAVDGPTGPAECHVFPATYRQCGALLVAGAQLSVAGRVDTRKNPPVVTAMEITLWADAPPATPSAPASAKPAAPAPEVVPLAAPIFGNANGWADVMKRAGEVCQCSGQCGATHRATGGRCDARHGAYAGKGCPPIRLEAAPEDPTVPEHIAARMTADQLMAWCAKCRAGAVNKAKGPTRGKKAPPPQSDALFEIEPPSPTGTPTL